MKEVVLSTVQKKAAEPIVMIEGPIIISFEDAGSVFMETETGESRWQWVLDRWEALESPWWDVKGGQNASST